MGKLSLVLNSAPRHAVIWGRGGTTSFLTSALDGGEWSASHLGRFIPKERIPVLIKYGLNTPSVGLDIVAKRKFCPTEKQTLAIQPVDKSL
jgi:hypothetical protein